MSALEDRVRAATEAVGQTWPASDMPPLRRPESAPAPGWARWSRRLAPFAAAAAVIAVAVAMVTVRGAVHGGNDPSPAANGVGANDVPRYYVALAANGNSNFVPSHAVVRATISGALLGTITPSVAGGTIVAVAAAADDRTFVLDEQKWVSPNSTASQSFQARSFYLLRLSSSGQPAGLTKLPLTVDGFVTGMALSPDGTKLAIAVQPNSAQPNLEELRVYALATGAVRTWSGSGIIGSGPEDGASVSWTADGRRLAFDWFASTQGRQLGIWLLNLASSGSNLLADSREAVSTYRPPPGFAATQGASKPPSLQALGCQADQIVSPDGSAVICGAVATFGMTATSGMHRNAEIAFLEYSTATGKLIHVLGHRTIDNAGALAINVLWSNSSGSVLIVAIPNQGSGEVGVLSGNSFTRLPVPGAIDAAYAGAW
jgi:hypothetical protein